MSELESYNLNSEEDKRKLRKKVGQDINITIDDIAQREQNEKVINRLDALEGKDVTSSTPDSELGQAVRDALIEKYASKGVECPRLDTKEDFDRAVEIVKALPDKTTPSGTASLEGQYASMQGSEQGFGSVEEMLEFLYAQERLGNKDAKKTIEKLILKSTRGTLKGQQTNAFEIPESEGKTGIVDKVLSPLTVENEDESELAKLGIKKASHRKNQKIRERIEQSKKLVSEKFDT